MTRSHPAFLIYVHLFISANQSFIFNKRSSLVSAFSIIESSWGIAIVEEAEPSMVLLFTFAKQYIRIFGITALQIQCGRNSGASDRKIKGQFHIGSSLEFLNDGIIHF